MARRRFYRYHPAEEDPEELLHPERGSRPPWDPRGLTPCEKCDGAGRTSHECASCLQHSDADGDCPACQGRVRYEATCPACEGTGKVRRLTRNGISVFPDLEALNRYMRHHDADLTNCVLVELEGEPCEEKDFDADEGAVLIKPTRILAVHDVEGQAA